MIRFICRAVGCVVIAALIAGCGKAPPPPIVPVQGTVRIAGKPLAKAQVRFVPKIDHGPEFVATGVTDENGRYTLTCNGQSGACACENSGGIGEADIPANLQGESAQAELAKYMRSLGNRPIPQKYANLAESSLRASVTADTKEFNFDLTR